MSQDAFKKFINPKKNSVVKEEIRQDKKKARKEKREYFDAKKAEEYQARQAKRGGTNTANSPATTSPKGASRATTKPTIQRIGAVADKAQLTTEVAMPLNKFLAHCGICSRREAIDVIAQGTVKVNGTIATEPGYKVQPTDEIIYNGKKLYITKNLVYILLNKPKDYITTTDDPLGRKTVLELIKQATEQRVYPIGRLDRNTSGVLLLTNDGDLTQKLSHPSYEIKKIYEVRLDKNLTKNDFEKILVGLTLEDGLILVDSLAYADAKDKSVIGIEIHSGRNRIVRRIFESLGYVVKQLDRVMYAGLTKKNVERSKWRYLSDKEIRQLKFLNESKRKNKKAVDATAVEPVAHNPEVVIGKQKGREFSNKDINDAIGVEVIKPEKEKPVRVREPKVPQPRKYKTHSEKKQAKLNGIGKK